METKDQLLSLKLKWTIAIRARYGRQIRFSFPGGYSLQSIMSLGGRKVRTAGTRSPKLATPEPRSPKASKTELKKTMMRSLLLAHSRLKSTGLGSVWLLQFGHRKG